MNPHDICEWINVLMHWTNLDLRSPEQFPYPQLEGQLRAAAAQFHVRSPRAGVLRRPRAAFAGALHRGLV